ncbi:hypothetical protein ST47_g4122 [Ascochyta rabiei]|uniref:Heterokaryon incompatibility domain-containing protein n=1 Tax=Didymella rabiei TaxID=5454 RepID=A0A163G7Z2_DIDRA|nr:hypothetical protein ST47_g4122 [Ascochyta rabiei]
MNSTISLKISAAKGCQICRLLFHTFCKQSPRDVGRCEKLRIARLHSDSVSVKGFNDAIQRFEVVGPGHDFRRVQTRPDAEETYSLISNWLADCVAKHDACQKPKDLIVPRRLIEVTDKLRLTYWNSLPPGETYAALSHCWGSSPGLITTVGNLRLFEIHIDPPSLPRTFRDAIEVTRKLNIKHLWIDALCIIQDSQEDWRAEAAKMGHYYRNAHLTISALDAPDGSTGFLATKRAFPTARIDDKESWRQSGLSWKDTFRQSPLSRRGWVLQERLLSRRVLHYARDEVLWECMTCSARERTASFSDKDTGKRIARKHYLGDAASVQIKQWYDIVCQYSGLDLTVDTDVFAAIGGIARTFRNATGMKYAAGLWWEHLPYGFLWYCESTKLRDGPSVAPSWSWASRRGPVRMLCQPPAWVLDATCKRPLQSSVQDAQNYIASIVGFRLEFTDDAVDRGRDIRLRIEAYHARVFCRSSCDTRPPFDDPDLRRIISIYEEFGCRIGTGYLDHIPSEDFKECIAIVLMQQPEPTWDSGQDTNVTYLMLVEKTENEQDEETYVRIGIGRTVDLLEGCVFEDKWLRATQQRTFLLK